jgi:nitroreductase
MKRRTVIFCAALLICAILASSAAADIALPKPEKTGGDGIFDLIERRASGTREDFPKGGVSIEELSTILWATTGRNRNDSGWTVPMAGGLPPYVKIYAVKRDGVFLYDWKSHSLSEISKKNALSDITGDDFVKASPAVLILVSDPSNLGQMARFNDGNALAYTAAGAMSQNTYLAADALGISTRYMVSMNLDGIKRELKLKDGETPLCLMPLGKRR